MLKNHETRIKKGKTMRIYEGKNVRMRCIKYRISEGWGCGLSLDTIRISLVLVNRFTPNEVFLNLLVASSTTPTVPVYGSFKS